MQPVTPRQMEILRFISDYRDRHGYSPTMQEIADFFRVSKVTVFEHVGALEKKGLLLRGAKHKARSLQLSADVTFPDEQRPTQIPLAGRIAAGQPLEAVEDRETIDLEEMFARPTDTFCLRVTGESMIDDQICDGDPQWGNRRRPTARWRGDAQALLSRGRPHPAPAGQSGLRSNLR